MSLVLATIVVILFSVALQRTQVAEHAREATRQARQTVGVLRDPLLSDRDRERELQRSAVRLLRLSVTIAGLSMVAFALPLGGVFALDWLGWVSGSEVLTILQRGDFLLAAAVIGSVSYHASGVVSRR